VAPETFAVKINIVWPLLLCSYIALSDFFKFIEKEKDGWYSLWLDWYYGL
jgi:hypothetical protein